MTHPRNEKNICSETKRLEVKRYNEKVVSGARGKCQLGQGAQSICELEAPFRQAVVLQLVAKVLMVEPTSCGWCLC